MRLARMFCAALALVSAAVIADDFSRLREAVARADFSAAVPALEAAAQRNDPRALTLLASLYQQGQGLPHDSAKAVELYTRAAELGDAEAQFSLGNLYLLGEGVKADEAWALTYYRQAAAQGHETAARNLAELYRASGLAPTPLHGPPPTEPLTEGAARLRSEPALGAVSAVKHEPLATGVNTPVSPPSAGVASSAVAPSVARPSRPVASSSAALSSDAASETITSSVLSEDELHAIELARQAGIEVKLDEGISTAPTPPVAQAAAHADSSGEQDEAAEAYAMAQRYLAGRGVARSPAAAVQWLTRAAEAGSVDAKFEVGLHYLNGDGVVADEAMAITMLRDAALAGHAEARAKLQQMYTAAGVPMPELARPRRPVAPARESRQSSSSSAPLEVEAVSAPTALENSERHATRGATAGMMIDAAAEEEEETARADATIKADEDEHSATRPAQTAPSLTPPGAHLSVDLTGATIADAKSAFVAGDLPRSAAIFTALAEKGDAEAQAHIGYMTYQGEGVAVDKAKAIDWYRKAAAHGNRDAQYNLAVAYAFGDGAARNDAEALIWYRRAAEQGSAIAQYSLGVCYALGTGTPQDDVQAVKWYHAAAVQAYPAAQYNLGYMYRSGKGVAQDEHEAMQWFKQAANNGNASAQYSLGNMYRAGSGVERDLKQAAHWFELAAAQGHVEARASLSALESSH